MRARIGSLELVAPGEGRTFRLVDTELAVFRARDGRVHACQARCPHLGGRLADGLFGDGLVVCPLHARRYDVASGARVDGEGESIRTYGVEVHEGELIVELPDEDAEPSPARSGEVSHAR